MAGFSLISRHPRAARDSQPPPPNKLSAGGWELKGWRQIRNIGSGKKKKKCEQLKRGDHVRESLDTMADIERLGGDRKLDKDEKAPDSSEPSTPDADSADDQTQLVEVIARLSSDLNDPTVTRVPTSQLAQAIAASQKIAVPSISKAALEALANIDFKIPNISQAALAAMQIRAPILTPAALAQIDFKLPSISAAALEGLRIQTPSLQAAAALAMSNIDFSGISDALARQITLTGVDWARIIGPTLGPRQIFAEPEESSPVYSAEMKSAADYFARDDVEINSFDELNTQVKNLIDKNPTLQLVWRGARDASWGLHTGLFLALMRANGVEGPESTPTEPQPYPTEDQMVAAEKIMLDVARDQWRLDGMPPLEILARLQHYGAPTRLLDITRNPYIAAWFAVEEHAETEEVEGRLFAFATTPVSSGAHPDLEKLDTSVRLKDIGDLAEPFWHYFMTSADRAAADWGTGSKRRVWIPPAYDQRIVAQNAGFMLDGVPITSQKTAPYFKKAAASEYWNRADLLAAASMYTKTNKPTVKPRSNKPNFAPTFTYRISPGAKREIREVLESRFSYSRATLYPDIGALAGYLRDNLTHLVKASS